MAIPRDSSLACPYCGAPVEPQRERCAGCDARLLYGLVASPQADPRLQDRAAEVLAAEPGGPGRLEGRRRVREGLPLIVGLSRRRTEQLQSRLVDVGLVPRIGPAPRGTAPLEPERAHRSLAGRVALALAIPVLTFAVFRVLEPAPPQPEPAASPSASAGTGAVAEAAPAVELSAGFERERHGHLWLVLSARVRGEGPLPVADLVVRLRDETGTVLWTGSLPAQAAHDQEILTGDGALVQRTLNGRLSLDDVFLQGGERLTLEANWQGRESRRVPVEVPPPVARR